MIAQQRTRRGMAVAGVILVAVLVQAFIYGSNDHTIHRSSAQLQQMIDKHIPKTLHGVTIEAVRLELRDNHAEVSVVVSGKKLTKHYHLSATAIGLPDFQHSHNGEFYFKPINIQVGDISFDGKSPSEMLQGVARYMGKHEGLQRAVMDSAPKADEWMKDAAQAAATVALTEIPVYRLKDDNIGWVLRASLKNVKIVGDDLAIEFSLWKFTTTVLTGMVAGLVAIMIVLTFALA